jgi:hypothetical protein
LVAKVGCRRGATQPAATVTAARRHRDVRLVERPLTVQLWPSEVALRLVAFQPPTPAARPPRGRRRCRRPGSHGRRGAAAGRPGADARGPVLSRCGTAVRTRTRRCSTPESASYHDGTPSLGPGPSHGPSRVTVTVGAAASVPAPAITAGPRAGLGPLRLDPTLAFSLIDGSAARRSSGPPGRRWAQWLRSRATDRSRKRESVTA